MTYWMHQKYQVLLLHNVNTRDYHLVVHLADQRPIPLSSVQTTLYLKLKKIKMFNKLFTILHIKIQHKIVLSSRVYLDNVNNERFSRCVYIKSKAHFEIMWTNWNILFDQCFQNFYFLNRTKNSLTFHTQK